ncbi:MAG: response regulator [Gammaproteobacteria bacterium]|nr:response regulator [Gammaproteobacteria bacterium]
MKLLASDRFFKRSRKLGFVVSWNWFEMEAKVMTKNVIKVMVVDDHQLIRHGISRLLSDVKNIKIVGQAHDGETALQMTKDLQPDVVLMDLVMPGIGSLEATKRILRFCKDIKIIIMASNRDNLCPDKLLDIGAVGYLTKDVTIDELIEAIDNVILGGHYVSADLAKKLVMRKFDVEESPLDLLSSRELQVLMLIADGCRTKDIAERFSLSVKTISTYRHRIFNKLKIKNNVELLKLAMQYGLINV